MPPAHFARNQVDGLAAAGGEFGAVRFAPRLHALLQFFDTVGECVQRGLVLFSERGDLVIEGGGNARVFALGVAQFFNPSLGLLKGLRGFEGCRLNAFVAGFGHVWSPVKMVLMGG